MVLLACFEAGILKGERMPTVRMVAGKYYHYVNIEPWGESEYKLTFSFNRTIIDEIKAMEGARWHPDDKAWTIKKSVRNKFSLEYLCRKDSLGPYAKWLAPIRHYDPIRNCLMPHQDHMKDVILNRRQVIIAGEPGVGKTLAAIEAIEISKCINILWVGPLSALRAVELEFDKWNISFGNKLKLTTYDSMKKLVSVDRDSYDCVVWDEAHKLASPTTQRYEAARHIAQSSFDDFDDPYLIEMTGTPVPHDPSQWWALVELIRPGFIKEPNIKKFKKRLAFIKDETSAISGGWFPKLVTWWDDEKKCAVCGQYREDMAHDLNASLMGYEYHDYKPSINEVANLYKRLKGIVDITFKKDVLKSLPEKNYRIIRCTPSDDILNAAKLIVATARNVVTANMLLRELSDGFQYKDIEVGTQICDVCHGSKTIMAPKGLVFEECPSCGGSIQDNKCISCLLEFDLDGEQETTECPSCSGTGEIPKLTREAIQVTSPKEEILKQVLEEFEETGRAVIYAGFQGSVDRCLRICKDSGWETIRVDGRGWLSSIEGMIKPLDMLRAFQDKNRATSKLAFVAQPDSGGIGLTLTESCFIAYYSNSFNGASRAQSEDRIHRPGADPNKGVTIIDILNLPSDEKVLTNLKEKKRLQDMTLGELGEAFQKEN